MSPEDHFETLVDVFVTMLKLGVSDAASVSVSKVAQLGGNLRLMAKELSQYMRFYRVELQHHFFDSRSMLITAANVDVNNWLADVAALGTCPAAFTRATAGGERDAGFARSFVHSAPPASR